MQTPSTAAGRGRAPMRNAVSQPYLDRISVVPHMPDAVNSEWRQLLIQPVSIPSLTHTGIHTAFEPSGEELVRPDGKVHHSLKQVITSSLR